MGLWEDLGDASLRFQNEMSTLLSSATVEDLLRLRDMKDSFVQTAVVKEMDRRVRAWMRRRWWCEEHGCHNLNCPQGTHHPFERTT